MTEADDTTTAKPLSSQMFDEASNLSVAVELADEIHSLLAEDDPPLQVLLIAHARLAADLRGVRDRLHEAACSARGVTA